MRYCINTHGLGGGREAALRTTATGQIKGRAVASSVPRAGSYTGGGGNGPGAACLPVARSARPGAAPMPPLSEHAHDVGVDGLAAHGAAVDLVGLEHGGAVLAQAPGEGEAAGAGIETEMRRQAYVGCRPVECVGAAPHRDQPPPHLPQGCVCARSSRPAPRPAPPRHPARHRRCPAPPPSPPPPALTCAPSHRAARRRWQRHPGTLHKCLNRPLSCCRWRCPPGPQARTAPPQMLQAGGSGAVHGTARRGLHAARNPACHG